MPEPENPGCPAPVEHDASAAFTASLQDAEGAVTWDLSQASDLGGHLDCTTDLQRMPRRGTIARESA